MIAGDENAAVEGWHDHAFPGWRELPIVPSRLRDVDKTGSSKAAKKWIAEHYPKSMQVVGRSGHHRAQQHAARATSRAARPGAATTSPTPLSIRTGRSSRVKRRTPDSRSSRRVPRHSPGIGLGD